MVNQEIKFAVFGESGSGKTAFMASYLGNLTSLDFLQKNGYRLRYNNSAQRLKIQSQFERMKANGSFPASTTVVEHFECHMDLAEEEGHSLRISWVDYPGHWWTEKPFTKEMQKIRENEFSYLLESQVGVLLIDGKKYSDQGMKYVKKLFHDFNTSFITLVNDATSLFGVIKPSLPKTWIIALSKCDILPENLTANAFGTALIVDCDKEILALNSTIESIVSNNVILFSSVKANGNKIFDTVGTGLELFSAVGIAAEIDRILDDNKNKQARHPIYETIIEVFDKALDFFVPERFRIVVLIAKKLDITNRMKKMQAENLNSLQGEERYIASALTSLRNHLDDESLKDNHARWH